MDRICALGFLLFAGTVWAVTPSPERSLAISIGAKQTLVFRRVSPAAEQLDYPDFYVQETEVTNAQFKAFLDATGRTKDDSEVLRIVREREPKTTKCPDGNSGTVSSFSLTIGAVSYSLEDETTIWREGRYPEGLGEHPVALVTLDDATAFADWLNRTHKTAGLFRLPTWNEWMVAAYGKSRNYPWGAEWESRRAHTSYGIRSGPSP